MSTIECMIIFITYVATTFKLSSRLLLFNNQGMCVAW